MNHTCKSGILAGAFAAIFASGCVLQGEETDSVASYVQEEMEVRDFETFAPIPNAVARLSREEVTHESEMDTTQLTPGHVVIMSYIVYNAPENCTAPTPLSSCSVPDSFDPNTEPSLQVLGGTTANEDGEAEFEGIVGLGAEGAAGEIFFGPGLTNLEGSEVHYLVTDKGEPIEGSVEAQLTTFAGGCDVRDCVDLQFAIFTP